MIKNEQLLSLSHLTVLDATPLELIDAAVAGGFNSIGLRIVPPQPADVIFPVIGDEPLIRDILTKMDDCGVGVLDTEAVWLAAHTRVAELEPAMELSARLGAHNMLVVGNDDDEERQLDNYVRLCDLAAGYGLTAALEYIPYCRIGNLRQAQDLVRAANRPNAKVLIDALHVMRSGDGQAGLSALVPEYYAYCQLADFAGPRPESTELLRREARTDRLYPGQGEAPLKEILAAFSAGFPIGVEAPGLEYAQLPVVERGRLCGEATRRFLSEYDGLAS